MKKSLLLCAAMAATNAVPLNAATIELFEWGVNIDGSSVCPVGCGSATLPPEVDASLFEINPVIKAADDRIFAADAKVVIDNNALYRHPDIQELRDFREEDHTEVEASRYNLSYVKLSGNVGCMVNGAGLAMATMDIIKQSGGDPANFLDVGGAADSKRVEEAFRIILKDEHVQAILVNIFGGIVRCDNVATGVVEACKRIGNIKVPIIVRLQGTNAEEGKKIIDDSDLEVLSAIRLQEAAEKVSEVFA